MGLKKPFVKLAAALLADQKNGEREQPSQKRPSASRPETARTIRPQTPKRIGLCRSADRSIPAQLSLYSGRRFMSDDTPPRRRVNLNNLNWLGKSVFAGGTVLRLAANLIEFTADRVSSISARSKEAFDREVDPNIEDAQILDEYPHPESSDDA